MHILDCELDLSSYSVQIDGGGKRKMLTKCNRSSNPMTENAVNHLFKRMIRFKTRQSQSMESPASLQKQHLCPSDTSR